MIFFVAVIICLLFIVVFFLKEIAINIGAILRLLVENENNND